MGPSAKVWLGAAALLGGAVLAHCVWLLVAAWRMIRLFVGMTPGRTGMWAAFLEVAVAGAAAWFAAAVVSIGALALWLRVQRIGP